MNVWQLRIAKVVGTVVRATVISNKHLPSHCSVSQQSAQSQMM